MNNLTNDFIAIDTNVFEHILNPDFNTDDHIDELLTTLFRDKVLLIVDSDGRIEAQYENRIAPKFRNASEKGNNLSVLRLWFVIGIDARKRVNVNLNDGLMGEIDKIIRRSEKIDRIFVYVAFKEGRILTTNDETDIVTGLQKERNARRARLKNNTRKVRRHLQENGKDDRADILTSKEAHEKL